MLSYEPGPWRAAVRADNIALLPPEIPAALVTQIWRAMEQRDGLAAVLESLVASFGVSFSSLPAFAVVDHIPETSEQRVIVRGEILVTVIASDGTRQSFSGAGASTWNDRSITAASAIYITASGRSLTEGGERLPLCDGVAGVTGISWSFGADSSESLPRSVAPEPAVAPATTGAETLFTFGHTETMDSPQESPPHVEEAAEPIASEDADEYDDLIFGETRIVTSAAAALRLETEADPPAAAGSPLISGIPPMPNDSPANLPIAPVPPVSVAVGDHDGKTISVAQLRAMQEANVLPDAPAPTFTPQTHSAPTLVVSTGERYDLDRSAVIGRRPRAVRAAGAVPLLVAVPSPEQDISRSHVELRVEGGDILATDLDTTNGTRLLRNGKDPMRLHPGEQTLLVAGDRLDLGDGVLLSFEGI